MTGKQPAGPGEPPPRSFRQADAAGVPLPAIRLAFEGLAAQAPAAGEVVKLGAVLAPEPVPAEWFTAAAAKLHRHLRKAARDGPAWREVISQLTGSGLFQVEPGGLAIHRPTQAAGENNAQTLTSATSLAIDLQMLGEFSAALELDTQVLARRRRVLGDDHPDTLNSAGNLAVDLHRLGEHGE